ncbi:MAG: S-methyl-5-thioribose-1-phosphate isomerase, partial [Calditrichota bacterium]
VKTDACFLITHCNTGALATGGIGTALGVIYQAHEDDKDIQVFANETRPVLQGARLTAWELTQAKIPVNLVCDSMSASLMQHGKVDVIIVGADRIAADGSVANKIGTYSVAVLAKFHNVPFYVAAPFSTFDMSIHEGENIPIEVRGNDEIRKIAGKPI